GRCLFTLLPCSSMFFLFYCYAPHRSLHSFPTRRSSDLFSSVNKQPPNTALNQGSVDDSFLTDGISAVRFMTHAVVVTASLEGNRDRKSTRLNSSHVKISYAVFCLKKKKRIYPRIYYAAS